MTRDYKKEELIIKMNKIRESSVESVPRLAKISKKKIIAIIITDSHAGTRKEIDVSNMKTDTIMQKMIEAYNDIFATELVYIQEKNLDEGPYLTVSFRYKTSIFPWG